MYVILIFLFYYDSYIVFFGLLNLQCFLLLDSSPDLLLELIVCFAGGGCDDMISGQDESVVQKVQCDASEDVIFAFYE